MTVPSEVLIFATGLIAGFVNVSAGGGSTLTLPVLLFSGLDAATANGTNRIAIFLQNVSGISSFKKQKLTGFRLGFRYALFTIPGAIAGAFFSINISQIWFERIVGIIMLATVASLFKKPPVATDHPKNPNKNILFYIGLFLLGFYGGFIQIGIGFLLIGFLFHFLHISLVKTNYYKLIIVLVYTIPALSIFIWNDKIAWIPGLTLAAGNMIGAWISAHFSVKKGDRFIRYILAVIVTIMAFKLFIQ